MNHLAIPDLIAVNADNRLTLAYVGHRSPCVTYLGYPLRLSPDEARLLGVLLNTDPDLADSDGFTPAAAVLEMMRKSVSDEQPLTDEERLAIFFDPDYKTPRVPYSLKQITILATRINRKASAIGGRKLIQGKSHHGYRVNPYM